MAKVNIMGPYKFTGDKGCIFCENRDLLWDYTSGPYANFCKHITEDVGKNCGVTCKHFKLDEELEDLK